jgi:DNA-binding protein StpA
MAVDAQTTILEALDTMLANPRRRDSILRRLDLEQLKQLTVACQNIQQERIEEENQRLRQLEERRKKALEALDLLQADGLEPEDLIAVRERLSVKGPGKVPRYMYKDEFEQERTWTGQGRTPKPIQDAINQGSKLEDFLIK